MPGFGRSYGSKKKATKTTKRKTGSKKSLLLEVRG